MIDLYTSNISPKSQVLTPIWSIDNFMDVYINLIMGYCNQAMMTTHICFDMSPNLGMYPR